MAAVLNACAHRGAMVCRRKKDNRATFTCPFHGWTFNNAGKLLKVKDPRGAGYPETFKTDGSFRFRDRHNAVWGKTFLVNGRPMPYMKVANRKYRFRILNASHTRGYKLSLDNGQPLVQIATDGGGEGLDHLADGAALAGAEVPGADTGVVLTEVVERCEVAVGEVEDVDVVADGGAVLGIVV